MSTINNMLKVKEMARLAKAINKARDNQGYSVKYINYKAIEYAEKSLEKYDKLYFFGVKNTSQISKKYITKLTNSGNYIWLTVDDMANGGRAIDVDRVNPLTGRIMTGSTSAGCINVLIGINDFAIGTDGGGSVLAPAMSCNLPAIMAKGLGLKGREIKKSTDNIKFVPGIGIIANELTTCIDVIRELVSKEEYEFENIKVGIPKKGDINLPILGDVNKNLNDVKKILSDEKISIIEEDLSNVTDRSISIKKVIKAFNDVDIIITKEGPIDLFGEGDSVLGNLGKVGSYIQNKSGKYLLKIANMIDSTAITIPTENLGVGILIIAKSGLKCGMAAIKLAEIISKKIKVPSLYKEYFDGLKYDDILFEVE
ncbi:amidase [Thermoanaerobacterium thermosaccharolyticum]|uniref:Amidase n=2 Tax=Thermoanaerobacterium thermosaccharolyticum TaxID=1517 RepID=D9TQG3_THETC|nr:amidase [Thermoanaerobacterium thermosaccharolyticum]ADL69197.1 conserved hypothetical protein [Thermoanaerobacterium thermosaccharolyticum DSM 571]MBE0068630.1 amidase [Thermoanaerobacterium thermosaccharolyticum]MBE0227592.1 amidase [Thermoanaerobacterium thermosaccharolyticum]PHO06318.1 amidase [Thermoanaerobacterium thermosaccharolyticum]